MRPFVVVVPEERSQADSRFQRRPVFLQVHFLVFDGPPQSFDEDVVQNPTTSVHADFDAMVLEDLRKSPVHVLRPLVGVEDFRPPVGGKCLFQGTDAKGRTQRRRQLPGQHLPAAGVHDNRQVDKTTVHPDVGDVRTPDLVRPRDVKVPQKIRVDLVFRVLLAQPRLLVDGFKPHFPQEPSDSLGVDLFAPSPQPRGHPLDAPAGMLRVLLVKDLHQKQVPCRFAAAFPVIEARTVQSQKLALSAQGESFVFRFQRLAMV